MAASAEDTTEPTPEEERGINLASALPFQRLHGNPAKLFELLHGDDSDKGRLAASGPSLGVQQRGLSLLVASHTAADNAYSTESNNLSQFMKNVYACHNKTIAPFALRKDLNVLVATADLHAQAYSMLAMSKLLLDNPKMLGEMGPENEPHTRISKVLHRVIFGIINGFEPAAGLDKWNRSRLFAAAYFVNVLLGCGIWVVELGRESQQQQQQGEGDGILPVIIAAEVLAKALVESNGSCGAVEQKLEAIRQKQQDAKDSQDKIREEIEELSKPTVTVDTFVQERRIMLSYELEIVEENIQKLRKTYKTAESTYELVLATQQQLLEILVKLAYEDAASSHAMVQSLPSLKCLTTLLGSESNQIVVACAMLIGMPQRTT
jgi:hypothetical protein